MDDSLEKPTSIAKPEETGAEEEYSSGDEDQGPDWTKIPGVSRPVIPKRGEKDFEPNAAGGSGLQRHVLDRSRNAMLNALRATPAISSKSVSHAVWYPEIARAHVTVAKGIHFANMGHSVSRNTTAEKDARKVQKRLELLPEEALYLVERGAMFCWEASQLSFSTPAVMEDATGVPMSVQQAFAGMIGQEDLTLEKYQVFAYLRRLGYVVMRAKPPNSHYPIPAPSVTYCDRRSSILGTVFVFMKSVFSRIARLFSPHSDWWRPFKINTGFHCNITYPYIFKSLRFLRTGYGIPLHTYTMPEATAPPSPYEIFYHLYKPSTPFKKTAPPPPDYHVVVVNARTTPIPSVNELTALFGVLPELPPPMPRRRQPLAQQKAPQTGPLAIEPAVAPLPFWRRIFPWAIPVSTPPPRQVNPFLALKTGKKMVVVAAVDASTISFFRFGQGLFEQWPMQ